jgi:hypothetical protein
VHAYERGQFIAMDENISYFREAFTLKLNIWYITLGIIASIFIWRLWFLALFFGIEILYLIALPTIPGFRRIIRARHSQRLQKKKKRDLHREIYSLRDENRQRYEDIRRIITRIKGEYERFSFQSKSILMTNIGNLDSLYTSYMKMMISLQKIQSYMKNTDKGKLAAQIDEVEETLKGSEGKLREINETKLDVLRKRLEKYDSAKENIEILKAQIDTLEETLKLLHDQILTMEDPTEITLQISSLLENLESTEMTVREIEAFIDINEKLGYT